jgi:hypothetical protein
MAIADIGDFVAVDFTNGTTPPINATNLDALENRVQDIDDALSGSPIYLTNTQVGIGGAPTERLDIIAAAGATRIGLARSNATTSGSFGNIGFRSSDGYYTAAISGLADAANDAGALIFRTASGSTATDMATVPEVARISKNGNLLLDTTTAGTSGVGVLGIGNGTEPTTSPANMIQVYSKDSSAGSANATLAIRTEQAVESIGTFTASHKLRVWINGVEYWLQLDAV